MHNLRAGFLWTLESEHNGVLTREQVWNLVPTEGLNYILTAALKNGVPFPNFYIGLYEGAYTPTPDITAATLPTAATELTAYVETTRQPLVLGDVAGGEVSNALAKAEFTGITNGKLVQGGFISSAPTKGATTGVLVSAVKFSSPRPLDAGALLRVTAAFKIVSI